MCAACGGTCGTSTPRLRGRLTVDVNIKGRRLRITDAGGLAPLYVARALDPECAGRLTVWARSAGLAEIVAPDEMHVTVAYSKAPVDWFRFPSWQTDGVMIGPGGPRRMEAFKAGVVVLRFASPALSDRWREFRDGGCSWDWPDYAPHVTVAKGVGRADLARLKAYAGPLLFGPEEFGPVKL